MLSERVFFFADDPAPYIDGVRINSPHYLCKLTLNENSAHNYTLVISQYEKTNTIFYTLRAYATCPFTLVEIGSPYKHTQKVSHKTVLSNTVELKMLAILHYELLLCLSYEFHLNVLPVPHLAISCIVIINTYSVIPSLAGKNFLSPYVMLPQLDSGYLVIIKIQQ